MPSSLPTIVLDDAVAEAAGLVGAEGVVVLPRARRRGVDADAVTEAVADAGATALVLVRPPWADASMGPVAAVALLLGRDLVWLPPDLGEAGWAAALVAEWAQVAEPGDLVRRAQVAVGLASLPACRLPRRPWGSRRLAMPALGPDVLARWCDRLWEPCERCSGGGAPGSPCPSCRHEQVAP